MPERRGPAPDAALAEGWRKLAGTWARWAEHQVRAAELINAPLLEHTDIAAGQRVLDLASGVGEPALGLARRVGEDGRVVATDLSAEMLAAIRVRALREGLSTIGTAAAGMECLPFPDASFDRLTCRLGIMFSDAPRSCLDEAARVLRRGGKAAYAVWGPREDTTVFEVIAGAVARLSLSAEDDPMARQFRFAAPGALAGMLAAAGLDPVEHDVRTVARPRAGSDFWRPSLEMTFGHRLDSLEPDIRRALEDEILAGLEPHREGDRYTVGVHVLIVVGTRR